MWFQFNACTYSSFVYILEPFRRHSTDIMMLSAYRGITIIVTGCHPNSQSAHQVDTACRHVHMQIQARTINICYHADGADLRIAARYRCLHAVVILYDFVCGVVRRLVYLLAFYTLEPTETGAQSGDVHLRMRRHIISISWVVTFLTVLLTDMRKCVWCSMSCAGRSSFTRVTRTIIAKIRNSAVWNVDIYGTYTRYYQHTYFSVVLCSYV